MVSSPCLGGSRRGTERCRTLRDPVERYLLLSLRIGATSTASSTSTTGPRSLSIGSLAEALTAPGALAEEAKELAEAVAGGGLGGDPGTPTVAQRKRWFAAQLEGLTAVAERLDGSAMPYEDEVRRCYGVEPRSRDRGRARRCAPAPRRAACPGTGDLGERYRAWRRERDVPTDVLLPAAEAISAELRRRSDELFGLPEGESAAIELVSDEPWAAFNYYLGGRRSRVAICTDIPTRADFLADLVAHELYPGHHTQHALKEALLADGRGQLEESIAPVGTPQSLIDEGVAMNGLDILGPDAEAACARSSPASAAATTWSWCGRSAK